MNGLFKVFGKVLKKKEEIIEQYIVREKEKYPCKNCIVSTNCSKLCDKLEMDEDVLLEHITKEKCCPDCGSTSFYEGPSGGISTNVMCAGCKHRFNFSLPFSVERIGL